MNNTETFDFNHLLEAVKQLSKEEKLILNDVIWNENMSIPEEQQILVMERKEKSKKNPELMIDWDEAVKTLRP